MNILFNDKNIICLPVLKTSIRNPFWEVYTTTRPTREKRNYISYLQSLTYCDRSSNQKRKIVLRERSKLRKLIRFENQKIEI